MTLRDHLFGAPADERGSSMPIVARFQPESGEPFVLDRSDGRQALMRFESSSEIWVLEPTAAPRGDVIYKNDMGEAVLRATRLGGLTLFTPDRPGGVAAAFVGQASLLRPAPVMTPAALLQSFAQASERAARAARHPITFEAEEVPLRAAPLFADAAGVVAEAFVELSSASERSRRSLTRYSKVRFALGRSAGASASGDTMKVTVAPDRGLAGRPSSHRIASVLSKR
jgi:hypothetical protein